MKQASHLNLKWTVAHVDRLLIAARSGRMSVDDLVRMVRSDWFETTRDEVEAILEVHGVEIAGSAA